MSSPLIQFENVSAQYGESRVLFDVSFQLNPGEALGLLGKNGMGKTTTISTLFGLVKPTSGRILIDGQDVTHAPTHDISHLGLALVPEGRGIFSTLSVEENLLMSARSGVDGSSAWDLERVYATFPRLQERRTNAGSALSGGEQQMLAIGRALMTNPRVMVLDEATEGLAPLVRQEIWSHIATVSDGGIATIVVDKDLKAMGRSCTQALVLEKGRVAYAGAMRRFVEDAELHTRLLGV